MTGMKKALRESEGFLHCCMIVVSRSYNFAPQLGPGYVGAAVGLLSQYILTVKLSSPP